MPELHREPVRRLALPREPATMATTNMITPAKTKATITTTTLLPFPRDAVPPWASLLA
ncbi:hypothetical protein ABZ383_15995 [Streptomyces sp. NPDC005900]|uniref:hypothetical protein n=1 Tax=unclassified Streptomyces TaxID=2593676 RepID=UPI00340C206C